VSNRWPSDLPKKPLVEAILEVKWGHENRPDPAYPLTVGRLYERARQDYAEIEDLPIAQVPAEVATHFVRHRFRQSKGGWPLVQIGPGILTLNATREYHWEDFNRRAQRLLPWLYEAHPRPEDLAINNLLLRYINAIEFDYLADDALEFLASNLKVGLRLPSELLQSVGVTRRPTTVGVQLGYPVESPAGVLRLQLGTGVKNDRNAVIWEIHFMSTGTEVPQLPRAFPAWLEGAHTRIEGWFFGMVEGELLDRFRHS